MMASDGIHELIRWEDWEVTGSCCESPNYYLLSLPSTFLLRNGDQRSPDYFDMAESARNVIVTL
jgi:hypothetical protein